LDKIEGDLLLLATGVIRTEEAALSDPRPNHDKGEAA